MRPQHSFARGQWPEAVRQYLPGIHEPVQKPRVNDSRTRREPRGEASRVRLCPGGRYPCIDAADEDWLRRETD